MGGASTLRRFHHHMEISQIWAIKKSAHILLDCQEHSRAGNIRKSNNFVKPFLRAKMTKH